MLCLAVKSDVTAEILLSMTRNSPRLELLYLDGVVGLSAAQMSEIGQSCPNVKNVVKWYSITCRTQMLS